MKKTDRVVALSVFSCGALEPVREEAASVPARSGNIALVEFPDPGTMPKNPRTPQAVFRNEGGTDTWSVEPHDAAPPVRALVDVGMKGPSAP